MSTPPVATKLNIPRRRRGVVPRRRLTEALDAGRQTTLTLVSAPAGFGKTTLLTEWLARTDRPTAWVSLDDRDNDPVVFVGDLMAALRRARPDLGADVLERPPSGQVILEDVLATVVNELDGAVGNVILVLDDFHRVESGAVHQGMSFLLEHLPDRVQLVIATRADPALPLARLRACGDLVEIRAEDLRFTDQEARTYLRDGMGLALADADVAILQNRAEGWIAALQLAGLSLRGRGDAAAFIDDFAGDNRFIVDYLVEEVLQQLPADRRDFLLATSILERLNGPLCDAVLGCDGGSTAVLRELDRANLFLVRLDDRRHWYRYHHLFADVLRTHLLDEMPGRVPELHRRAGAWCASNGEPFEAIRHLLAGGEPERAADLVESEMPALRSGRQEVTLRRWLEALPEEVLRARPLLSTTHAGVLLMQGELDGVEQRLRDAERWLDDTTGKPDRADDDLIRDVRSEVALYRAAQARALGDVTETMSQARRVLEIAGPDHHLLRGAAAGLLGLAHWTTGELSVAHRWWSQSLHDLQHAGYLADTLGVSIALADIRLAQGRLRDALATYAHGLDRATGHRTTALRGAADMHVGISQVLLERGDIDAAGRHLAESAELGEHAGLPQNRHRWLVASARLRQACGDLGGAEDLLDEAERRYVADMFPDVWPIAALRARVWIAQGRWTKALDQARLRAVSVDDDPTYLRECDHITLARALVSHHAATGDERPLREARHLLDRLLQAAQDGDRQGSAIEILVIQAIACQASGDPTAALASLAHALTTAEPEGYQRIFVDEQAALEPLLRTLARRGIHAAYASRLLAVGAPEGSDQARHPALVDPLSARELDILRLLRTDLDGPGIARELVVSLNTVRTHTRNIYAKLGVNNRRAAIRRAAELGVLPPHR